MKIRQGFVSNSSSTSFCIVGVGGQNLSNEVFRAVMKKSKTSIEKASEAFGYGVGDIGGVSFCGIGPYGAKTMDEALEQMELNCSGFSAEELLENNSLVEARKIVSDRFKEFGVDVPVSKIDLCFGESHSD